jgi:hypothetical protein
VLRRSTQRGGGGGGAHVLRAEQDARSAAEPSPRRPA